jgi:hypothetical protein
VAVALVPAAALEVCSQRFEAALALLDRHQVPAGAATPDLGVEEHLRTVPEGAPEGVLASVRNRDGLHARAGQPLQLILERGHQFLVDLLQTGEVIANHPGLGPRQRVEGEDHDPLSRHPRHLRQPCRRVVPVVDRDDRHRRVEAVVFKRQVFGSRLDRGRRARGPLGNHHLRGLDRRHLLSVRWLVGAGPGTHVNYAARCPESRFDPGRDAWIRPANLAVADAHPVISLLGHGMTLCVSAADLPAETWPELQQNPSREDELPVGWVVVRFLLGRLHTKKSPIRKLPAQKARLIIDSDFIDGSANEVRRIRRKPVRVLRREAPKIAIGIANLHMKDIRIAQTSINDLATHRTQRIREGDIWGNEGCHR